jgi:predicted ATPase
MFKSMRLKNFKAYKDSGEIPLAPLTIIVGTNNSGKSTLFHALLALAQTARDSDQGWAPRLVTKGLADLNGYHDIIHGKSHARSSSFEISVGLDAEVAGLRNFTAADGKKLEEFRVPDHADISFGLDEELNEIAVRRSTLRLGDKNSISVERRNGHWKLLSLPNGTAKDADFDFWNLFPFIQLPKYGCYQEHTNTAGISSFCARAWLEIFSKKVNHIGPLRERVPWYSAIGARTNAKFGSGGENLIADLASKEKDPDSGKTRLELVNDWFATRKILERIRVETDRAASVRMLLGDEFNGPTKINIAAMGEGVSQILPIIAYSLFGMNNDCLLVEQPEIHLHPALQAELGELFIDITQTGRRQILVETHSEHLVLRVRRRVAEGKLKLEDVAILYVEKRGSESIVRKLDMTERGHFNDWPQGFFDEAYQESRALAMAANRKGR